MFYREQMDEMNRMKSESPDGNIYFSTKTIKEPKPYKRGFVNWDEKSIPEHRKALTSEQTLRASNLSLFYGEEETSVRVWQVDDTLNFVYKWLLRAAIAAMSTALFLHVHHRYQMRYYAGQVVQRIHKEGGRVVIEDDKLTILMDGKVQEVITADEPRQINTLQQLIAPRQHLKQAINELMKDGPKKDFTFYARVIKAELKDANPSIYAVIMSSETTLSQSAYGVNNRATMTGSQQVQKDPAADVSIFDAEAFMFYIIKFGEVLGVGRGYVTQFDDTSTKRCP